MFERLTGRARRVVGLAQDEARMLNHYHHIGTEHLLLGLSGDGDGVAARVLVRLGADPMRVREHVIQLIRTT
jgi:ATP-dependent Clp protease ATP-binding subunit ClpC